MEKHPVNHVAPGLTLEELAERSLTDPNPDLSPEEAARLRLVGQIGITFLDSKPASKQED